MNLFTREYDKRQVLNAILAAMLRGGEESRNAGAVERFKALWRAAADGSTAPPRATAGVTEDGRYAYRYDDEGRFYATPMDRVLRPSRLAFDDAPA